MRIELTSIHVNDQDKALAFYTDNPAARAYQQALYEQGIPHAAFAVDDIRAEYERLKALGVVFPAEPAEAGEVVLAMFDDTCGSHIMLYEVS